MPLAFRRAPRIALLLALAAAAAGCSTFDRASHGVVGVLRPYKVEVVQGNFVSSEQVAALRPGMSRQQVRDLLGTPLLTSVFHENRWDYVFTLQRPGQDAQQRRLSVFFEGEALVRHEGDAMPSEAEFVASLTTNRKFGKVPALEATEAQLKAFTPAHGASAPAAAEPAAAQPAPATNYPPLEPTR